MSAGSAIRSQHNQAEVGEPNVFIVCVGRRREAPVQTHVGGSLEYKLHPSSVTTLELAGCATDVIAFYARAMGWLLRRRRGERG